MPRGYCFRSRGVPCCGVACRAVPCRFPFPACPNLHLHFTSVNDIREWPTLSAGHIRLVLVLLPPTPTPTPHPPPPLPPLGPAASARTGSLLCVSVSGVGGSGVRLRQMGTCMSQCPIPRILPKPFHTNSTYFLLVGDVPCQGLEKLLQICSLHHGSEVVMVVRVHL